MCICSYVPLFCPRWGLRHWLTLATGYCPHSHCTIGEGICQHKFYVSVVSVLGEWLTYSPGERQHKYHRTKRYIVNRARVTCVCVCVHMPVPVSMLHFPTMSHGGIVSIFSRHTGPPQPISCSPSLTPTKSPPPPPLLNPLFLQQRVDEALAFHGFNSSYYISRISESSDLPHLPLVLSKIHQNNYKN